MSIRLYGWPQQHGVAGSLGAGGAGREATSTSRSIARRARTARPSTWRSTRPARCRGWSTAARRTSSRRRSSSTSARPTGASAGCGRRRARARRAPRRCAGRSGATTELHAYMMQWLYHGLDTPVSYAPADRSKATADYNHGQYLRTARRAGGAARRPRLHPGRGVLARRHAGRVGAAVGRRPRRQRRGPQEHRRLARPLPRPPGVRAHRRRGLGASPIERRSLSLTLSPLRGARPDLHA